MPSTDQPVHQVILYSKPGCHLCDYARDLLDEIAADPEQFAEIQIDEIDIRRDESLFAQYRYRIPVITIDGKIVAEGNLERTGDTELRRALARSSR
jgi:glutaredoxin